MADLAWLASRPRVHGRKLEVHMHICLYAWLPIKHASYYYGMHTIARITQSAAWSSELVPSWISYSLQANIIMKKWCERSELHFLHNHKNN